VVVVAAAAAVEVAVEVEKIPEAAGAVAEVELVATMMIVFSIKSTPTMG